MLPRWTKLLLLHALLLVAAPVFATHQQTVEIDVKGMTCGFCVYGLKKTLEKLAGVDAVDVSLQQKKVRVRAAPDTVLDERLLHEAIEKSGFTSAGKPHYGREEHR